MFVIISENSVIEIGQALILFACLGYCIVYIFKSHLNKGKWFWMASVLFFVIVIRRELSFLSDGIAANNPIILGFEYEWWEDAILSVIGLSCLLLLIYSRRYLLVLLTTISKPIYISVFLLIALQITGEQHVLISKQAGNVVEEYSESIVYAIALYYLVCFNINCFESRFTASKPTKEQLEDYKSKDFDQSNNT